MLFLDLLYFADRKLTKELCDVIDDFSLVNFTTLDIQVCTGNTLLFQFSPMLVNWLVHAIQ